MKVATQAGNQHVLSGRRQERDPIRCAVIRQRDGHRQPSEVEQVDEIGVGPKVGVELDRIGLKLGDRIGRRSRGHHEGIDLVPHLASLGAESGEPIEPVKRLPG